MNLKVEYRKKLAKVLIDSNYFENVYFKVGVQLDLSKITIHDSDKPTLVVAFAGGNIANIAINQDAEAGYNDQNAIWFYIIGRDNYLNDVKNQDFTVINEIVEEGQKYLIKAVTEATKFRGSASQFEFTFSQYEYLEGNDLNDNNFSIIVQYAEHNIEIYS